MDKKYPYKKTYLSKEATEYYKKIFSSSPIEDLLDKLEKFGLQYLLLKHNFKPTNKTILDAPCGYGRIIKLFEKQNCNLIGIDYSENMLEEAKKYVINLRTEKADLCSTLPIEEHSVDLIVSFRFFMNIKKEERIKVLTNFNKLLNSNGLLVCNVNLNRYSLRNLVSKIGETFFKNKKLSNLSYFAFRKNLLDADFKIIDWVGINLLPTVIDVSFISHPLFFKIEKYLINLPLFKFFAPNLIFLVTPKQLKNKLD